MAPDLPALGENFGPLSSAAGRAKFSQKRARLGTAWSRLGATAPLPAAQKDRHFEAPSLPAVVVLR